MTDEEHLEYLQKVADNATPDEDGFYDLKTAMCGALKLIEVLMQRVYTLENG